MCRGCFGRGCIVVAEFGMESLHLFHADIVCGVKLQFLHGGGWVKIDVVGEGFGFESECHALKYHFLIKVWCAKGSLDESPECLVLIISDAKKGDGCSLMWAAADKVSGEHVGEGVKVVDGV